MNIIISNISGVPIYEQIKEQIKAAIFGGEINEGELLPSIRSLAKDLKISVITTMRAYSDLEQDGFVVNVQGKGCYVKPQNPDLLRERKLKEIEEHLLDAIDAAKLLKMTDDELSDLLKLLMTEENDDE